MPSSKVVHVVIGKHYKYEIVQTRSIFETTYSIHRNGKYHRGSYDSMAKAVAAAEKEG